jgi:hypothetical protein
MALVGKAKNEDCEIFLNEVECEDEVMEETKKENIMLVIFLCEWQWKVTLDAPQLMHCILCYFNLVFFF